MRKSSDGYSNYNSTNLTPYTDDTPIDQFKSELRPDQKQEVRRIISEWKSSNNKSESVPWSSDNKSESVPWSSDSTDGSSDHKSEHGRGVQDESDRFCWIQRPATYHSTKNKLKSDFVIASTTYKNCDGCVETKVLVQVVVPADHLSRKGSKKYKVPRFEEHSQVILYTLNDSGKVLCQHPIWRYDGVRNDLQYGQIKVDDRGATYIVTRFNGTLSLEVDRKDRPHSKSDNHRTVTSSYYSSDYETSTDHYQNTSNARSSTDHYKNTSNNRSSTCTTIYNTPSDRGDDLFLKLTPDSKNLFYSVLISGSIGRTVRFDLDSDNNVYLTGGYDNCLHVNSKKIYSDQPIDTFVSKINCDGSVDWLIGSSHFSHPKGSCAKKHHSEDSYSEGCHPKGSYDKDPCGHRSKHPKSTCQSSMGRDVTILSDGCVVVIGQYVGPLSFDSKVRDYTEPIQITSKYNNTWIGVFDCDGSLLHLETFCVNAINGKRSKPFLLGYRIVSDEHNNLYFTASALGCILLNKNKIEISCPTTIVVSYPWNSGWEYGFSRGIVTNIPDPCPSQSMAYPELVLNYNRLIVKLYTGPHPEFLDSSYCSVEKCFDGSGSTDLTVIPISLYRGEWDYDQMTVVPAVLPSQSNNLSLGFGGKIIISGTQLVSNAQSIGFDLFSGFVTALTGEPKSGYKVSPKYSSITNPHSDTDLDDTDLDTTGLDDTDLDTTGLDDTDLDTSDLDDTDLDTSDFDDTDLDDTDTDSTEQTYDISLRTDLDTSDLSLIRRILPDL